MDYTEIKIAGYKIGGYVTTIDKLDKEKVPQYFLDEEFSEKESILVETYENGVYIYNYDVIYGENPTYKLHPIDQYKISNRFYFTQRHLCIFSKFMESLWHDREEQIEDFNIILDHIYNTKYDYVNIENVYNKVKNKKDLLVKLMGFTGYNDLLDFEIYIKDDDKIILLDTTETMTRNNNKENIYHPLTNKVLDKSKIFTRYKIKKQNQKWNSH